MKIVAAILLFSVLKTEAVRVDPVLIANVSMLLARFHDVDCIQIFRSENVEVDEMEVIHRMWKELAVVESKVTTGIYTYRRYLEKKTTRPRKVSCYRSLKIMSDDDDSKSGYALFSMRFSIKDAVWVLFTDTFSLGFFQGAKVVFDDLIIIAVIKNRDFILFHEVYRVREDLPLKVLFLGNWTRAGGLTLKDNNIYDRRSDLEGIVLRTASVMNWPTSYVRDGKWKGYFVNVWKDIQKLINCSSVDVKSDNLVGMRSENGSWNGLVGMAVRDEIDVLVTDIVIDKERSRAVDFLHPIIKSRFQIYTRHLGYKWQWDSIAKPFAANVWAAVVGWVLVGAVFWSAFHGICLFSGLKTMDFGRIFPMDSFFFVVQTLSQQGYHMTPNSIACRVLFFVSYAVSSVLIPSYSASLVSSLAEKVHLRSFDSLQDMVADGSYRLMVKENTAQHAFFAHSKDPFIKLAYEKLVKPTPEEIKKYGMRRSIKALCHLDNYAVMGVEDMVEGRLHNLITIDCPIVRLTHPVSTIHLSMATAKNNPFWGVINYHLGKLQVTGVVERLKRAEFPLGQNLPQDPNLEVGMQQVVSVFTFMWVCAFACVFLLLLEVQYFFYRSRKSKMRRKKRALRFQEPFKAEAKKYGNVRMVARVAPFPDIYWN